MINYTFKSEFKYAQIFANVLKTIRYSRKTENVKILVKGKICAKSMTNFFAKIVQSATFCPRLFKEL